MILRHNHIIIYSDVIQPMKHWDYIYILANQMLIEVGWLN